MTAKSDRKKIARHERQLATELGGRKTFASGAGDEKGDGRVAQRYMLIGNVPSPTVRYPMRIESKVTSKSAYTMSSEDWDKLVLAAMRAGEHPLFHIQITVPGIGHVELVLITSDLAAMLGVTVNRPWDRPRAAKSYQISWARWSSGYGPAAIELQGSRGSLPDQLVLMDYLDFKNIMKDA
jgi:hypothetical protein